VAAVSLGDAGESKIIRLVSTKNAVAAMARRQKKLFVGVGSGATAIAFLRDGSSYAAAERPSADGESCPVDGTNFSDSTQYFCGLGDKRGHERGSGRCYGRLTLPRSRSPATTAAPRQWSVCSPMGGPIFLGMRVCRDGRITWDDPEGKRRRTQSSDAIVIVSSRPG